ncbi:MAG: TetR/AcrR family transcriptional regulator [Xanthomonadales bacterium]|nr:TetR/AcrR family transcriptional regulator [Xanthomonadales bacterium]MBK7146124.1 TetR/AcrR family transcriptional regulator [Xanthomonadales bacterium]
MAPKTRERILDISLAMFNDRGEPNVTTNHIADELEISPGNLYYHFRNKEDIVENLFARYEEKIDRVMVAPDERLPNLEDIWLQLHLAFETMWEYRFVYRDLVDITSRNRKLRMHFARILKRATENATDVLKGLVEAGIMRASRAEIEATASNVILVATFWLSFNTVRGGALEKGSEDLTQGIFQLMMLIAPFLRDAERLHLNTLADNYRK